MKKNWILAIFIFLAATARADEWRIMAGSARDIAVGGNGVMWSVGNTPAGGGFTIQKWNGSAWELTDGGAVRIAVDPQGEPWVVNNEGAVWKRKAGRWTEVPGAKATDIAVAPNGVVWIVSRTAAGAGFSVQYLAENISHGYSSWQWNTVPGGGVRITVAANGQPWVVDREGNIHERFANGSWYKHAGTARDIAAGVYGPVWVIGTDNRGGSFGVHTLNRNKWEAVDGAGTEIAVDPSGMPVIVNHLFEIYKRHHTRPVYSGAITITPVVHDFPYTGKIEAVASDPTDRNHLMVGSVGGIFETFNGLSNDRRWEHNRDFDHASVLDVLFTGIPGYTKAWAVTGEEFSNSRTPQIWEKNRDGRWGRAEFAEGLRLPANQTSAYRVINGPDRASFFACGDFGVAYFNIAGIWRLFSNNVGQPVYSIAMLKNGTIAAGTADGIFTFSAATNSWTLTNTQLKFTNGESRYKLNTDFSGRVFLATELADSTGVQFSADGITWGKFKTPPSHSGAAGGFVSVYMDSLSAGQYTLFVSNRYKFYSLNAGGTSPLQALRALTGAVFFWNGPISPGHDDTRQYLRVTDDRGMSRIIMTSDGGFHISTLPVPDALAGFSFKTDRPTSGLNNLEVYNLSGTEEITNFGTQHNGFGALNQSLGLIASGRNEGYVISRRGPGGIDPRTIIFAPLIDAPTGLIAEGPAFGESSVNVCGSGNSYWKGPDDGWGNPIWLGNHIYIQDAKNAVARPGVFPWRISRDDGCTWQSLPDGNNVRSGMKAFFSIGSNNRLNLFVGLKINSDSARLARLANPLSVTEARWMIPSMNNMSNFIAIAGADFLFNPVFAVNPSDPDHVLAVEARTGVLKESRDWGNNWTEVTSFTRQLTGVHHYLRKGNKGMLNIRSIAFSPFDSDLILIGTAEAGIFISRNGGRDWSRVSIPGLLNVTDFHWRSSHSIIVSSYGHGLFHMTM